MDVHLPSLGDREACCCKLILLCYYLDLILSQAFSPCPIFLFSLPLLSFSDAQPKLRMESFLVFCFLCGSQSSFSSFLSMPTFLLISPFLLFPYVFLFLPFPHGRSAFVLTLLFFSFISFLFVFFLSLFTRITLLAYPLPIRHSLMLSNVILLQGMTIANN